MFELNLDILSVFKYQSYILLSCNKIHCKMVKHHVWSMNDINLARDLFKVWRKLCMEHVVGAGHLMDDILRHGLQDVYWCYKFECKVNAYMRTSRNKNHYLYDVSFALYYT